MVAAVPKSGAAAVLMAVYQSGGTQPASRATSSTRSRAAEWLELAYTQASTGPPGRVTRANSTRPAVGRVRWFRTNAATAPVHRTVPQREGEHVGDDRRWPRPGVDGEHVHGQVNRDGSSAAGSEGDTGHAGTGPDVEHRAASERDRTAGDELFGDRCVDQRRTARPPPTGGALGQHDRVTGVGVGAQHVRQQHRDLQLRLQSGPVCSVVSSSVVSGRVCGVVAIVVTGAPVR
jgi:hypothetical protein